MKIHRAFTLGGIALLLAFPALSEAQTRIPTLDQKDHMGDVGRYAHQKAVERFDAADSNKDGRLSREEVAERFSYMSENFDRMDLDHDGVLSWEEFVGHNRWKKE